MNRAAEIRTLAERQMGAFLAEMPKATGAKGNPGGQGAPVVRSSATTAQTPTLAAIGITKDQSSRAQKLAAIPEPEFRERLEAGFRGAHVRRFASAPLFERRNRKSKGSTWDTKQRTNSNRSSTQCKRSVSSCGRAT
ncbi:hypothetical protein ASA1KI_39690 [Opitutales bacterium ASA1]|nr:hypothetical protein ASA1KI_39690 [Opitutales bacterium ASA1]